MRVGAIFSRGLNPLTSTDAQVIRAEDLNACDAERVAQRFPSRTARQIFGVINTVGSARHAQRNVVPC
jgi:hypothetical protein